MTKQPFIVAPGDYGPALSVLGAQITVLASNARTFGYEITLQAGEEGVGPPPHSHDWDESFFVLEGGVEFSLQSGAVVCKAGTLVHVPADTVHSFRFCAGGARMLEITGQGGRATQMFKRVSNEFPAQPTDIPKLVNVLRQNGVTVAA
jgi:quercetin dioxygenase-like cupin family protein